MKILIILIISLQALAQSNLVSVLPEDMAAAKCIPQVSQEHLVTKKDYIEELYKYGLRGAGLIRQKQFKTEHLKDVLMAVNYFPKWMGIANNSDWDHIRLRFVPDKDLVANAVIMLGKKWLDYPSLHRQAIIIHELSHRLSNRFGGHAYTKYWQNLEDNWLKNRVTRIGYASKDNPDSEFVSIYARKNPSEDWAESLTSYRINPELLKRVSPVKYEFFKNNVYLGKEFLDEEDCKGADNLDIELEYNDILAQFLADNYSEIKKDIKEINKINFFGSKKGKTKSLKESVQNVLVKFEKDLEREYTASDFKLKLLLESAQSESVLEQSQINDKYKRLVE